MGLFEKKFCDVCGEKIGILGNRKLQDGNLCKDCAKKLSPWFDDRRHSTLEEIKSQLEMREENRRMVNSFRPSRVVRSDRHNLYIDEMQQMFAVSVNLDKEDNPDIISLSLVTGCSMSVDEDRKEIYRTDQDGDEVSYNPPRYEYSYDYYIYIYMNHPYIDEMKLRLNSMEISADDYNRRQKAERAGQEMMSCLQSMTGCTTGGMGMNHQGMGIQPGMGMNHQGMGMQPGIGMNHQGMGMQPGMGMNHQGMGIQPGIGMNPNMPQNMNMQGGMSAAAAGMGAAGAGFVGNVDDEGAWICQSCGATNTGRFCESCGSPRK